MWKPWNESIPCLCIQQDRSQKKNSRQSRGLRVKSETTISTYHSPLTALVVCQSPNLQQRQRQPYFKLNIQEERIPFAWAWKAFQEYLVSQTECETVHKIWKSSHQTRGSESSINIEETNDRLISRRHGGEENLRSSDAICTCQVTANSEKIEPWSLTWVCSLYWNLLNSPTRRF